MSVRVFAGLAWAGWVSLCAAADWPQFRGPAGTGVTPAGVPAAWSADRNLAWKVKLPGSGWAQPVAVGGTLFVTAAVSDPPLVPKNMADGVRDPGSNPIPFLGGNKVPDVTIDWRLLALDADTGKTRWVRTVATGKPKYPIHPSNTYATETPAADADRVYAYFGATGTLAAFDHAGAELWKVELGAYPTANGFGTGSSPALYRGKVYVQSFNDKNAFLAALDARTGKEVWRATRKPGSAWSTPLVWRNSKRTEVVACGDRLVTSHDPDTGAELWRLGGIDTAFAPSPAADGDVLLFGASSPFSSSPLYAVTAGAAGDITSPKGAAAGPFVPWSRTRGGVGMASPVAAGGYLYVPGEGTLTCYDAATGRPVYRERLQKGRMVAASAVLAGDKLLVLDEAGTGTLVKPGPAFEVVGGGKLDDTFWATPTVAGDRLFLRGVAYLYCVKE